MMDSTREPLGRGYRAERDRVEGYQVITMDGVRIGTVVGTDGTGLLVRYRRWLRRSLRTLPVEQAVVRDVDRTVVMLASPEAWQRRDLAGDAADRVSRAGRRR